MMRLALDLIADLQEMPRGKRYRLLSWCHLCSFLDWRTWAGLFLAVAMALVGQMLVRYIFPAMTTRQAPLYGCSGAVVCWLIGSHLSWKIRVHVVQQLIRRRFPHLCQNCGYDLRATIGRCPECGTD